MIRPWWYHVRAFTRAKVLFLGTQSRLGCQKPLSSESGAVSLNFPGCRFWCPCPRFWKRSGNPERFQATEDTCSKICEMDGLEMHLKTVHGSVQASGLNLKVRQLEHPAWNSQFLGI
eukprot:2901292-Rhodomonas_salina.1